MRKSKMTLDEMLAKAGVKKRRKAPSEEEFPCKREQNGVYSISAKRSRKCDDVEHRIQQTCVRWFNLEYPEFRGRLFAVPNGGRRDALTGAKLKAEGVIAGVSDFIFLKSNRHYGALLIEMKKPGGRQSAHQRWWQQAVCKQDEFKYVVCYSLDDFMREIRTFLSDI